MHSYAFSDGDSASERTCPTARWSNIVSLPQRARGALDPLSQCEHAQNSLIPAKGVVSSDMNLLNIGLAFDADLSKGRTGGRKSFSFHIGG